MDEEGRGRSSCDVDIGLLQVGCRVVEEKKGLLKSCGAESVDGERNVFSRRNTKFSRCQQDVVRSW